MLTSAKMFEVCRLFDEHHYIGSQCADPTYIFALRDRGGLFGDNGEPICAAIFAPPASFVWGPKALELVRLVREPRCEVPLSQFIAECLATIKREGRFILVVSYADPGAGHHGGVYQAGNWIYVGKSSAKAVYENVATGRKMSQRSWDQSTLKESDGWVRKPTKGKHTYLYPLTRNVRKSWTRFGLPYPKPNLMTVDAGTGAGLTSIADACHAVAASSD